MLNLTATANMIITFNMNLSFVVNDSHLLIYGDASKEEYELIAEGVTYQDTAPFQPDFLRKVVVFVLYDGEMFTAIGLVIVNIRNTNDLPTVVLQTTSVMYDEESDQPVYLFPNITLCDPDPDPNILHWAQVEIVNPDSEDTLQVDYTFWPTLTVTTEPHSIFVYGQAPIAEYRRIISNITFENMDPALNLTDRKVRLVVSDGENTSEPVNLTIMVQPYDDPPLCFYGNNQVSKLTLSLQIERKHN